MIRIPKLYCSYEDADAYITYDASIELYFCHDCEINGQYLFRCNTPEDMLKHMREHEKHEHHIPLYSKRSIMYDIRRIDLNG